MSLEDTLNKTNELIAKLNENFEQFFQQVDAADAEDKPKATRTRKPKEEAKGEAPKEEAKGEAPKEEAKGEAPKEEAKADEGEGDREGVIKRVGDWVKEVKEVKDEAAEFSARKDAAVKAFSKLDGASGSTVMEILKAVPPSQFPRVDKWLEKQKTEDKGFGAGRFTAKPGAAAADSDDDI